MAEEMTRGESIELISQVLEKTNLYTNATQPPLEPSPIANTEEKQSFWQKILNFL